MIRKEDYLKTIIVYIRSKSGIDYQNSIRIILSSYYKNQGKTYEMPSSFGGDFKNDGWCREDGAFYQIYSPEQYSGSFSSGSFSKFCDDFEGLAKHVYSEGLWGGEIHSFIFLVNSRGKGVPADPRGIVNKEKIKIETKYNTKIDKVIMNDDAFISDILCKFSIAQLRATISIMGLSGLLDVCLLMPSDICSFFVLFGEIAINESVNKNSKTDYKRVSTDDKIKINDLIKHNSRIQSLLPHLSVVDKALSVANGNIRIMKAFEKLKKLFITNYQELKEQFHGDELYDKLLDKITMLDDSLSRNRLCAELVMVYIFDRCDIFEKSKS